MFGKKKDKKKKHPDTGWEYRVVEGEKKEFEKELDAAAKDGWVMSNGGVVRTVVPDKKEAVYTHIICRFTNPNPESGVEAVPAGG